MIMSTQWLTDLRGRYGINMQAVIEGARELGLDVDWHFFRSVKAFENEVLSFERGSGCNAKKKEKCRAMFGDNLEWACANCEEKDG